MSRPVNMIWQTSEQWSLGILLIIVNNANLSCSYKSFIAGDQNLRHWALSLWPAWRGPRSSSCGWSSEIRNPNWKIKHTKIRNREWLRVQSERLASISESLMITLNAANQRSPFGCRQTLEVRRLAKLSSRLCQFRMRFTLSRSVWYTVGSK